MACACNRDNCKECWAAHMEDTAEITVVPVTGYCETCSGTRMIPGDSGMDDDGPGECPDCCGYPTPHVHDAVIDPADAPLIVPVPHGYQEPCS